jgi:hypothetical protein
MKWDVCKAAEETDELEVLLADGWEPFAVVLVRVVQTDGNGYNVSTYDVPYVWLRRQVTP